MVRTYFTVVLKKNRTLPSIMPLLRIQYLLPDNFCVTFTIPVFLCVSHTKDSTVTDMGLDGYHLEIGRPISFGTFFASFVIAFGSFQFFNALFVGHLSEVSYCIDMFGRYGRGTCETLCTYKFIVLIVCCAIMCCCCRCCCCSVAVIKDQHL